VIARSEVSRLDETKAWLRAQVPHFPRLGLVLGSGLGGVLDSLQIEKAIPYSEIPNLLPSTVPGHGGKLVIGNWQGARIACLQGRLHHYEGHPMNEVVFPCRMLAWAGVETFILTNAAGGLHSALKPADLVLIKDHINLQGTNPLVGKNEEGLGPRFPEMNNVYDAELRKLVCGIAKGCGVPLTEGIYVALSGPCYETPSEVRMCRQFGGDVVGMSTVPEAIALRHMGKKVIAFSSVTNLAAGVTETPPSHEEVLAVANLVRPRLEKVLRETARRLGGTP
jgi:purine-nucleoside phosphorylase